MRVEQGSAKPRILQLGAPRELSKIHGIARPLTKLLTAVLPDNDIICL